MAPEIIISPYEILGSQSLADMSIEQSMSGVGGGDRIAEALIRNASSKYRDNREWALYTMDLLMPKHNHLVFYVLHTLIQQSSSDDRNGLGTVSLYLGGSRYVTTKELQQYYDRLYEEFIEEYGNITPQSDVTEIIGTPPHPRNSGRLIVIVHGTWTRGVPLTKRGWSYLKRGIYWVLELTRLKSRSRVSDHESIPWPAETGWYKWPEPFPKFVDAKTGGAVYKPSKPGDLLPFCWSGGNSHTDRMKAALYLSAWVGVVRPKRDQRTLTVIAHSHGGNVALAASARHELKINDLILLGTPIRTEYPVNLKNINKISNVYSNGDNIQWLGAVGNSRGEGRTLSDTREIENFLMEESPGHSQLHDEKVWRKHQLDSIVL